MIADVYWGTRDETRRYLSFADIGGDPPRCGIFPGAGLPVHLGAPMTFGGSMQPARAANLYHDPFSLSGFPLTAGPELARYKSGAFDLNQVHRLALLAGPSDRLERYRDAIVDVFV